MPSKQSERSLDDSISYYSLKYEVSEPLARAIMKCESGLKPHAKNHNVKGGNIWSTDYSYWQINDFYHQDTFAKMGWDITDPKDNLEAGFYLLAQQGVQPWSASKHCWN